jgi:hypothetical protein
MEPYYGAPHDTALGWRQQSAQLREKLVYPEKRRTPRYIFIASAELFEERSEVRVASRVSELSLYGCYLDMMNPFPVDTIVLLKIFAGDTAFKSRAKVIYAQTNMGSGMAFIDVEPDSLAVLQHWLEELAKEQAARAK